MAELTWHYPENLNVARMLLQQPGIAPHGGGTTLLKRNLEKISGLMDLSGLKLSDITIDTNVIRLGATATYADVIGALSESKPNHILVRALSHAASTPLRNRITVGGSVAASPPWSDLIGPLLALDATVHLAGDDVADVPLETYLTQAGVRKQTLITGVSFTQHQWQNAYHRWTRTRVDYPAFTLTVLLSVEDGVVRKARAIATGTRTRFTRMGDLEAVLTGMEVAALDTIDVPRLVSLDIPSRRHGSGDYLSRMATVELERLLAQLAGGGA